MKKYLLSFVLLLCLVLPVNAQVTNLIVCGSDTNWTFESGSAVSWQYNVSPNGATAIAELWLDVNNNGSIDSAIDKNRFTFPQTDGVSNGDGPSDLDGVANGVITFASPVGLAPGNFVFRVSQGGASINIKGTITHLPSPAHTISGTVTPPSGESAANLFLQIQPSTGGDGGNFWEAVTDANGAYTIEMSADTAGNPWRVRFADNYNPFPPNIPNPSEYTVTITGNHSGFDFSFGSSAAKIVGYLRNDYDVLLTNYDVFLNRNDVGGDFNRRAQTDGSGYFEMGLAANELSDENFTLGSSFDESDDEHEYLAVSKTVFGIRNNDSLFYNLVAYKVNSTIQGQVRVNGNPPGFPIKIVGNVDDSAHTSTWADSATGNFSLEVSNKLYNYNLFPNDLPEHHNGTTVSAHAGETGVIINITVNGVSEREEGIPSQFILKQNYPNPFNPTTVVDYDLNVAGHVRLSLYNVLGEEVLSIINQEQSAGKYRATIDASSLSSGMYFYKLQAREFSSMKKMVLIR